MGNGALDDLADRLRGGLGGELPHGTSLIGLHAPNDVHHTARLGGRDANEPRLCPGFHRVSLRPCPQVLSCLENPAVLPASRQRRRERRSSFSCPRKVRVGANSPNLWPIIASVMKTGTCLRPSCTAMVCPIMSGTTMDRRDQVLMTFFVPFSF